MELYCRSMQIGGKIALISAVVFLLVPIDGVFVLIVKQLSLCYEIINYNSCDKFPYYEQS